MTHRRGFTILETLLASIMGAILVAVVVGLLAMVDRTERLTARRERDTATLAQLHLVMDRTFGSLVTLDGVSLAKQASAASRPRMLLEAEPDAKGSKPPASELPLQRLEVVLEKPPVPPGWGGGPLVDRSYQAEDPDVVAARGVFEVRPGRGKDGPKDGTWSLWWRPLPPTAEGRDAVAFRAQPAQDDRAVLVADGLTACQWMAFKNRERSGAIAVTRFDDLPAYMEMQVATASGLSANWMFEVQWSNGPETGAEADMIAATQAQGGGPGAATGATGATGAAGGDASASPAAGKPGTAQPGVAPAPSLAPAAGFGSAKSAAGAKGVKRKPGVDSTGGAVPR